LILIILPPYTSEMVSALVAAVATLAVMRHRTVDPERALIARLRRRAWWRR
jgi:hypothetical protein